MRKTIVLMLVMVFGLAGCSSGHKSSATSGAVTANEPEPVPAATSAVVEVTQDTAPAATEATVGEEAMQPAATEVEEEPEDPWADMVVEDETAEGVFLLRGDKRYTLSADRPFVAGQEHAIGVYMKSGMNELKFCYDLMGNRGVISLAPILSLDSGDNVISVSSSSVPDLVLCPMYFYGYGSIDVGPNDQFAIYEDGLVNWVNQFNLNPYNNFEVRDMDGNLVEDYDSLSPDKEYVASWFHGTEYNEEVFSPEYEIYYYHAGGWEAASYSDTNIVIPGELTRDGYATYDLSGVLPGVYRVGLNGGLIEIK